MQLSEETKVSVFVWFACIEGQFGSHARQERIAKILDVSRVSIH